MPAPERPGGARLPANHYALGAIVLWATLAALGVSLQHLPPFLLTGLALVIGSVPAWPLVRQWRVPATTLLLGIYGLFGFHFLLFIALRMAPPVEANLVNYLWPLLMVVLAPLFLREVKLKGAHIAAAVVGFAGAAIAIVGAAGASSASASWSWGYLPAIGSAFIWASYSLATRRVPDFPTAAIGLFGLLSGLLSLLCHVLLEAPASLSPRDWTLVAAMGLGPLGAAFFLWDRALKLGDPRHIGILSYLTPLLSTALLLAVSGREFSASIVVAAVMIVGAAVLGTRSA